jgi:5-methyltetrahydropteroyltriglutamate--homocysteine methyltransferase
VETSKDRIVTTHVGRLQRPEEITTAMEAHATGRPSDVAFQTSLAGAVGEVVRQQADAGIDIVCDGEFGKLSWNIYLNSRLGGHELVPARTGSPHYSLSGSQAVNATASGDKRTEVRRDRRVSLDRQAFADFYHEMTSSGATYYRSPGREPEGMRWACTGPVTYIGQRELQEDLGNLRNALAGLDTREGFIPATSPIRPWTNAFYPTEEEYYAAVGEAMREEYRAIVDAGFILQIDDPHLPELWDDYAGSMDVAAYRKVAARNVEIVNHALRGIPPDRIRYHICWGSWHGPHAFDLPMRDVVDLLLQVNAQGYAIEAANARHEHEWQVWESIRLPDDKILVPGVVAHATNTIEHPELVAWRICNFASVVGRERVIAGTDCGLGYRVHPQIAWAKLKALAEGARIASAQLWH